MQPEVIPDHVFVANLRTAIERYLCAADELEAVYLNLGRLGYAARFGEMEAERREYALRRRELEAMLPRARELCARYRLEDPFGGVLGTSPGRDARGQVSRAIMRLHEACRKADWAVPLRGSLVQRLVSYFS